jgi:hypothetical protein
MAIVLRGRFYEFHRERVVSRPGQPLRTQTGIEIGPEISSEQAFKRVRSGKDVYILGKEDAYKLATQLQNGRPPKEEPAHEPKFPSPTGREDIYYRHYHPGGMHPSDPGPGHIYFGERGENFEKRNMKTGSP